MQSQRNLFKSNYHNESIEAETGRGRLGPRCGLIVDVSDRGEGGAGAGRKL